MVKVDKETFDNVVNAYFCEIETLEQACSTLRTAIDKFYNENGVLIGARKTNNERPGEYLLSMPFLVDYDLNSHG